MKYSENEKKEKKEEEGKMPTQKQIEYAQSIARALDLKLPQEHTRAAYREFINANQERFSLAKSARQFTDEQIARANDVDIVAYARSMGLELKRDGKDYRVKNYSGGFIITPEKNNWNWFDENRGGGVVQLCMFLENKTWQEAVGTLLNEEMAQIRYVPQRETDPVPPKQFSLPPQNDTNKHVFAYLTKTRGIDTEIVKEILDKGHIYENQQRSCVFVGRDQEGIPRHASVRSTNTSGKVYKKDVTGSQKKFSFSVSGASGNLNVFEAPIDALSYMSFQKITEGKTEDSYIALGGVTDKALEQYLKDHQDVLQITICTDGDEAGEKAANRISEKYGNQYKIIRHRPQNKDFNEDLMVYRQSDKDEQIKMQEVFKVWEIPASKKDVNAPVSGQGNSISTQEKTSQALFERWGEQYSELTNNLDFNTIIHQSSNIVKNTEKVLSGRTFDRINHIEESASQKQISFAAKMAETLHISLPEENTKSAYRTFIRENMEPFHQSRNPLSEVAAVQEDTVSYEDYLKIVSDNGSRLKEVPEQYHTEELLLAAVSSWGAAVRDIPESKLTPAIVLASVKQYGNNLKHIPAAWKSDEVCIAAYISSGGKSIRFTPVEQRDNTKRIARERMQESNGIIEDAKRQVELEELQEQGEKWVSEIENMLKEYETDPAAMVEEIAFAAKFYQYSVQNIRLMLHQNPGITYVASATAFEKLGYHVKDGENALVGRVPIISRYILNENNEKVYSGDYTPEIKKRLKAGTLKEHSLTKSFRFVPAFYDISQTDCPAEDYPSIFHMGVPSELHQEAFAAMKEFAEKSLGFQVLVTDLKSIRLRGRCEPDQKIIRINDRLRPTQALSTLCHEIAHGIIHTAEDRLKTTEAQRECEADIMEIMLESSLGLPIGESRREHLFEHYNTYRQEQADRERPYNVTVKRLIDRVQSKVFRAYAEDIHYYLNRHLPAEGIQNETVAEEVIKSMALLDSAYGTDHRAVMDERKEIFDSNRIVSCRELYQQTKEEYRMKNSFVPKLAVLKSRNRENFYLWDVQMLDEVTADLIRMYPDAVNAESLPYNVETGNILALKENVLADSRLYLVTDGGLREVTKELQERFGAMENKINCGFDIATEYQCMHSLLQNDIVLDPDMMKKYEYLCDTFGFDRWQPKHLEQELLARINLITEDLSGNNKELVAEYVFRTGNFERAEEYSKKLDSEPDASRKLLQEMRLVDSYKYMLWTIEQYEDNNAVQPSERITTGAYNSSAIPTLSSQVHTLSQINQSFLLIRKHASPESVKYYAIVEEQDAFRIAYVDLKDYKPQTVLSTARFQNYEEAEAFYHQYLETPNSRLEGADKATVLPELQNAENRIALSDVTAIGNTVAAAKHKYMETGMSEEQALELLRSVLESRYSLHSEQDVPKSDGQIQTLNEFRKMVGNYGKEHFIELCNLENFTDKDTMEEALTLSRMLVQLDSKMEQVDLTDMEDVRKCLQHAIKSHVTAADVEQAVDVIDYAVLSTEAAGMESEFENAGDLNDVLKTLKAAYVMPDKFCYVDYSAGQTPNLYTSDPVGNVYKKSLFPGWTGSVHELHASLKDRGYEICAGLDDFKAYALNSRIAAGGAPEKNGVHVRILESDSDMFPKGGIYSVYDFKKSVDKLYPEEAAGNVTYKLVIRQDQEIRSYIDTYKGDSGQNVYEQLYAKAGGQNPELSRQISRQFYEDQIRFNEKHLVRPLLAELKRQEKDISDSDELGAVLDANNRLKEQIRKLDLSPADTELLKLDHGSLFTEQITGMDMQHKKQQEQKKKLKSVEGPAMQ